MSTELPVHAANDVRTALEGRPGNARDPRVVGVLLAGGTSSRFGEANKLLAELDGDPVVRHTARTLLDAGLESVVAVLGHEAEAVRAALDGLPVRTVDNPDYEEGVSTSVGCGVDAGADADAIVFLPGDMPVVDPETVALLVDAYRGGLGTALAAANGKRRGNPVLFDRVHFEELARVEGDVGGRSVLRSAPDGGLIETDDPGVHRDVDTEEDLSEVR